MSNFTVKNGVMYSDGESEAYFEELSDFNEFSSVEFSSLQSKAEQVVDDPSFTTPESVWLPIKEDITVERIEMHSRGYVLRIS